MRIKAKVKGELNLTGQGVHWQHVAGDERDFPEDVGKKILTNSNYEKVGGSGHAKKAEEKKTEAKPEKKPEEKKKWEGGK